MASFQIRTALGLALAGAAGHAGSSRAHMGEQAEEACHRPAGTHRWRQRRCALKRSGGQLQRSSIARVHHCFALKMWPTGEGGHRFKTLQNCTAAGNGRPRGTARARPPPTVDRSSSATQSLHTQALPFMPACLLGKGRGRGGGEQRLQGVLRRRPGAQRLADVAPIMLEGQRQRALGRLKGAAGVPGLRAQLRQALAQQIIACSAGRRAGRPGFAAGGQPASSLQRALRSQRPKQPQRQATCLGGPC